MEDSGLEMSSRDAFDKKGGHAMPKGPVTAMDIDGINGHGK